MYVCAHMHDVCAWDGVAMETRAVQKEKRGGAGALAFEHVQIAPFPHLLTQRWTVQYTPL